MSYKPRNESQTQQKKIEIIFLVQIYHVQPTSNTKKSVMSEHEYDESLGEWDGDEFNGARFILYEVPDENGWSPLDLQPPSEAQLLAEDIDYQAIADEGVYDLSLDQHEEVKVWVARSQPRDQETGAIAFDISFNVGTEKESISRVPIQALMDLENNSFPYEEVTEAVNDWIEKAKQFPHTRRNCLGCWKRATKGKVLCQGCHSDFGEVIYADQVQKWLVKD